MSFYHRKPWDKKSQISPVEVIGRPIIQYILQNINYSSLLLLPTVCQPKMRCSTVSRHTIELHDRIFVYCCHDANCADLSFSFLVESELGQSGSNGLCQWNVYNCRAGSEPFIFIGRGQQFNKR